MKWEVKPEEISEKGFQVEGIATSNVGNEQGYWGCSGVQFEIYSVSSYTWKCFQNQF